MSVTIGQFSTSFLTLPPSFISTCLYLTILRIPLFNIIGWMKVWNRSHVVVHPSCFFLSFYWGWRMLDKAFLHLHQQYPPHNICTSSAFSSDSSMIHFLLWTSLPVLQDWMDGLEKGRVSVPWFSDVSVVHCGFSHVFTESLRLVTELFDVFYVNIANTS